MLESTGGPQVMLGPDAGAMPGLFDDGIFPADDARRSG